MAEFAENRFGALLEEDETPERQEAKENHKQARAGGKPGPAAAKGRRGKREFDRHSGTGRGREVSKGGRGAYNWGAQGDERGTGALSPTNEDNGRGDAAEEDDNSKSWEEYQKELAANKPQDDVSKATRKVVVDNSKFKAAKPLAEKKEEALFGEMIKGKRSKAKKKQEKNVISMDEFNKKVKPADDGRGERPSRGRGGARGRGGDRGRGGRGRGRGGPRDGERGGRGRGARGGSRGGRGAPRGRGADRGAPRGRGAARPARGRIDVNDESAFPSLK